MSTTLSENEEKRREKKRNSSRSPAAPKHDEALFFFSLSPSSLLSLHPLDSRFHPACSPGVSVEPVILHFVLLLKRRRKSVCEKRGLC
jgi:hypothetical protein